MKNRDPERFIAAVSILAIALAVWWALDRFVVAVPRGAADTSAHVQGTGSASRPADVGEAARGARHAASNSTTHSAVRGATLSTSVRHALPPVGTPLAQSAPVLERFVREGDANAACRLAFDLDMCRQLPLLRRAGRSWLGEEARAAGKPAAERARAQVLQRWAERRLPQIEAMCEGVSPEQALLAWDYGLASALGGNRTAIFHSVYFPWGLAFEHESTLEGWAQYRAHVGELIEAGVQAGDPRMFAAAAHAYRAPFFGAQPFAFDPVRAVAYQMAFLTAAAPAYRPQVERALANAMAGLDREQVEAARTLARALPPPQVPPGGIDWTFGTGSWIDEDGSGCEAP